MECKKKNNVTIMYLNLTFNHIILTIMLYRLVLVFIFYGYA